MLIAQDYARPIDPPTGFAGHRCFEIKPSEVYPAAIADMKQAMEEQRLVTGAFANHLRRARALPPEAWKWAIQPRDRFVEPGQIAQRAEALELARLWFTRMLHLSINEHPMYLHIVKETGWEQ